VSDPSALRGKGRPIESKEHIDLFAE